MRTLVVAVVAFLAACGGAEGRCDQPPCEAPPHRCRADADCFQTEFCDFENNSCGASTVDEGFCNARPSSEECERDFVDLACGCDGVYHASACQAASDGTDVDIGGGCPVPPNGFACGNGACLRDEQVCVESPRDAVNSVFSCERFPQCLAKPSCACFLSVGCDQCTEENGAVRVRCLFPDPNEG